MNKIDLQGRTAIVTGGARGIGFACAERLLQSGAAVTIWDRDRSKLEQAVATLREFGRTWGAVVDVADEASIASASSSAYAAMTRVDILVNNAGITGPNKTICEYSLSEWRQVLDVDLTGAFLCLRALLPGMMERGYGRVVNMASIAGKEGNPNAPAYSAAKAGLIGLTKATAKEVVGRGVVINCVTPAAAKTDLFSQMTPQHIDYMLSKIPMGRFVETNEIAALVAWLCSEECSFSTGAVFDLSGGRATY